MTAVPEPPEAPQSRIELARRYGVQPSTITRALRVAEQGHTRDPQRPPPPSPVNPGSFHEMWLPSEFDPWWAARPRRGCPTTSQNTRETTT